MTEVLLSSPMASFLSPRKAFEVAKSLSVAGLEFFPTRTGGVEDILKIQDIYDLPVKGIHFPFWWHTKNLPKVIASEGNNFVQWAYAVAWSALIGSGDTNCRAAVLSNHFKDAYCLLHPDVFSQMPEEDIAFFRGKDVYFENERAKIGERNDLRYITEVVLPKALERGVRGHTMFDPKHLQIDMRRGAYPCRELSDLWRELKPQGLHFGFEGRFDLPGLPCEKTWDTFKEALKENPPQYIVLEVGAKDRKLQKAREMIGKDLGI